MKYIHVGAGNWGLTWVKGIIPRNKDIAECVAVVDIVPEYLKNAETHLGLPPEKCYIDLDKALSENKVDFVTIAASIPAHEAIVDTVLKYGCHILSEKPLAHDLAACCRMYDAVKAAGIKFAVTMSHRYGKNKQSFESILKSGMYGKINYIMGRIHMARSKWRPPTTPGRPERPMEYILIDGGCHNIDMMRAFSGSNAEKVYADIWNFDLGEEKRSGRNAFVQMEMESGTRTFIEYSFNGPYQLNGWSGEYFRAECENAMIELDGTKLTVRSHDGYPIPEYAEIPLLDGDKWNHDLLMMEFVEWISGGEAPAVTIDDNMYSMAAMFSAVESFKTGNPVIVKEFWEKQWHDRRNAYE